MPDSLRRISRAIQRTISPVGLILIAGLLFMGAVTGAAVLDSDDDNESATSTTQTTVARTGIPGFPQITFVVTPSGEKVARKHCGLLAETNETMSKGMMGSSSLGGYDGMIFRFAADSTSEFYMANVPVPLSIAWFDSNGSFVSALDMPVCTVQAADCPRFKAAGPYRYAIEVLQGGLDSLGIGAGSTLALGSAVCA